MGNDERAEQRFYRSEVDASGAMIAQSVPMMIWVTDRDGGGMFFNGSWLAFTGRTLDDELGEGWMASMHPDDRDAILTASKDARDGSASVEPFEFEHRLSRFDGASRWVLSRAAARIVEGEFAGLAGATFDITERHHIEQERTDLLASANEANAHLATLQDLTARLAGLERPEDVAEVVLGQGVADLGGASGSLCLLSADGRELEVAAQIGYPEQVTEAWRRFPLSAPTPAGDAVRLGEAIYVTSLADLHVRYPIFGDTPIVGDEALACLPLATPGRGAMGAMVIGFTRPNTFPEADRRLLHALATQAATALARTRSRAALEEAREQLAYLADASARLAASLDLDETLATIGALAVPRLADRCNLYLLAGERVQTLVLQPTDPGVDIRTFFDRFPVDLNATSGVGAVLRTGNPEFVPKVDEAGLAERSISDERHELIRRIGVGAVLILPLRARGRMLGAVALTNATGRVMTDQQRALAEELAARAAVAVDNARLFTQQTTVARRLQASLLPPALPAIAGLDLFARYAAAGEGLEVGGDFYDCITCGEDRWLLVVGDVKGKGVEAAALTGTARNSIRAAAITRPYPSAVATRLNDVLIRHEADRMLTNSDDWEASEPRFCSVTAVALTRAARGFVGTVVNAGHPLPLLRDPAGQVGRVGRPGNVLGIHALVDLPETSFVLEPGSVLVCFTDGVSECHDGDRFFDEDGIIAVLANTDGTAECLAQAIEAAARGCASGGVIKDDMAILVVRVLA